MLWKLPLAMASCLLTVSFAVGESTWPQFRGPDGQGRSDATGLPTQWDESTNVVWKTELVGSGWSSPVFANGKAWVTSATEVLAGEEERQAKIAGSMTGDALEVARTITLWVSEIDLASGEVLRQIKLADVDSPQPKHSLNSFASPTPFLAEGRLYCHFGDYGTFCLDTSSGEIRWKNRIHLDHGVGPGSSPLLYKNLLVLTCDGMDVQYITALNAADGTVAWRTDRPPIRATEPDFRKAYSTPLVISVDGKAQMVIPGAQWCIAYNPLDGKEIWRVDYGRGFSNVPRPIFDGEHVFICTGYASDGLWAIRPDGHGDVTETHVDWKIKKQMPHMSSPVVYGQRLYTVSDGGVAQCFDASTGDSVWKKRVGGKFSASPLFADRHIYLCSHEGRTTVIAAGDEYQELAANELDGQLMASPVVVGSDLLLRTGSHLYRIGE